MRFTLSGPNSHCDEPNHNNLSTFQHRCSISFQVLYNAIYKHGRFIKIGWRHGGFCETNLHRKPHLIGWQNNMPLCK